MSLNLLLSPEYPVSPHRASSSSFLFQTKELQPRDSKACCSHRCRSQKNGKQYSHSHLKNPFIHNKTQLFRCHLYDLLFGAVCYKPLLEAEHRIKQINDDSHIPNQQSVNRVKHIAVCTPAAPSTCLSNRFKVLVLV